MPRQEGQPLQTGGHHIQIGGGGQQHMQILGGQQQMGALQQMGVQQQVGGMPIQWPRGGIYYTPLMAHANLGYGYQPMMAQQQQPVQHEMPLVAHHPAGGYNPNVYSVPEHGPHEG